MALKLIRISACMQSRDKSILLLFSLIFLTGKSFFLPIMLKILLKVSIFC